MHTRRAEVLNHGVCGFTTRLMLDDLTAGVMSLPKPDASGSRVLAVTLMLGSNDHSSPRDIFHVPIEEYEANLSAILALLAKRYPASVLLLLTLPPCIECAAQT
jgi:lysophospholipase L1-like esterase